MARKRSVWNRIRRTSHRVTVLAGDAQAISRGRIVPRVANRVGGRLLSRALRGVWR